MSQVFISESTGAAIYVFSDDHCPPHVHARHRGDGWIARVRFSYIGTGAELMSIASLRNVPLQRTVNRPLTDVEDELPACRLSWWITKGTVCLSNQWAVVSADGRIEVSAQPSGDAKRTADATYHPDEERLRVWFQDGTTVDVTTRP